MQLEGRPLFIRADASDQIGTGHMMRCLALAQAWQDAGGQVVFAMAMKDPVIEARLRAEDMGVVYLPARPGSADDTTQTTALAQQESAAWVVVDGYHFGAECQQMIKDSGLNLLFIDDNGHAEHYYADLVLNQNISASAGLYANREPYTRLLLGTRYVLLRREFLRWQGWKREIPVVARKVLVTLGGADPDNVTLKVVRALDQVAVDGLEAVVVVGGSNPHYEQLQSAIRNSPFAIRLERNVTNMPELMAWADVAVTAGGSTCWELACMGLPNLVLVLADNQRSIAERLDAAGVAVNLGWYENLSPVKVAQALAQLMVAAGRRADMARYGRELVDCGGSDRVLTQLKSRRIRFRSVCEEDCRLIWEWANEPNVRAVSFSTELIPWERHVQWFKSKLNDSDCIFYVAINEESPIGQVRYDVNGNESVISISIDQKFRGQGYGSAIIQLTSRTLFDVSNVNVIRAYVKQGNEVSARAFVKAGFKNTGITMIGGHQALCFILQKDRSQ